MPPVKKANILIVDDEMGPRDSLRMILKPHYNVYTAEKAGQAVEILRRLPIDLVTVDLRMPGLSGTTVLEKVKQQDPDIEAIIITGYGSMDSAIEGLRLGAFDYIHKPFDVRHVLFLVRSALERRTARLEFKQVKEADRRRAEKAEEMNRVKRQIVSALAHDIKSPLGIIMGCVEFLAMSLEKRPGTKKDSELLSHIQDSSQRIAKLVNSFVDATKVEAGFRIVRKRVRLNRLIREVGQQQMVALRQKRLTLKLDLDDSLPEILGDEGQLERVLWNLVGNAVKYTPPGGEIIMISNLEADHVCVKVRDTGMGIPQEEIPSLFAEFHRVRNSGRVEGSGLGLFIVKTIVEAHGGKVDAESKEREGTTFTVRFPKELDTASAPPLHPSSGKPAKR